MRENSSVPDGRSIRILLVYYSQSGEAERVAKVLLEALQVPGIELTSEILHPENRYPFPWRKVGDFFNVLPECHWGPLPALAAIQFDPAKKFDLVILIYQVWFLAPSLPVQSFLKSEAARGLQDTKVLTVSISRNMWQSASETMKRLLREHGARHIDNVVVTHQGPAWATFITTPRALLFGKKNAFWRIFPAAGIGTKELQRLQQFGESIVRQKEKLRQPENLPLLRNQGAVAIERRYLLAERAGWHCFRRWGRVILAFGRLGSSFRRLGVYLFVVFLVCTIPIVLPATMLIRLLFHPILRSWMNSYARRLRQPSDS